MILEAMIDEQVYSLNVPETLLTQASDLFDQLDRDMDQGWQMSRDWVAKPDRVQRGQIVANKLLTALETENDKLGRLMAGYLLARLPGLKAVELDIQGEMQNNLFHFHPNTEIAADAAKTTDATPATTTTPTQAAAQLTRIASDCTGAPGNLSKLDAMAQAGQDVTKVFKVGKGYRFSVFDHSTQSWQDGPLLKTLEEADRLRQQVFSHRYEALQRPA
ncbi:hypothetical protein [Rhabdochromatium marinum]|uniref:hypothetical protein n=1 Tax=Rhabdochromatium marinum TaxID=48729 RepID=UPI001903C3DF|nr:hypothetical protein [Rhabdochromatium marinum]MBK1647748.1 hypothetical protein [Rhabdochromatium marinum]